ncbi:DUF3108 domain-containing protein [Rhodobacteraceae bacterium KMM 6894]|nr:DUF3108 domain-containing protein [Rhodobacteraceae bacterium KMM 6894]
MRRTTLWITLGLMALGASASADTRATFDVRLLGLTLGQMQLNGDERGDAYAVSSAFSTTGLGRIADASFALTAQGRIRNGALAPQRYDEQINTGDRQSTAQLSYERGVPRITGGTVLTEVEGNANALKAADQGGTLDPLSALYTALRDQPRADLCTVDVVVFDGKRRSRIQTSGRADIDDQVRCTGVYTRLKGFSASAMKRQTTYPFSVTYRPAGNVMQAARISVSTNYGTADLKRR